MEKKINIEKIFKLLFIGGVFVFIFVLFSVEIRDSDFWWHLKAGEYLSQTGSLPATDPFAFTSVPKDPVNPESKRIKFILRQYWLAQLIFYEVYALLSFQGIILLRASFLTLLIFLLYKSVRREGIGVYASVILIIPAVIILSSNFTGERPQLFSFLFSFLLIFFLEGYRRASLISHDQKQIKFLPIRYLLPIPVVTLLWANMHGGFLVGIAIILGYLICEGIKYRTGKFGTCLPPRALKTLYIIGVLSVLVSFINPNTFNVISILFELEQSRYKSTIIEAMSPFKIGLHYADVSLFFLVLVISLLVLVLNVRKLDLTDVVMFSGLAFMGLSAVRFIPFCVPAAILMVARYGLKTTAFSSWSEKFGPVRHTAGILFAILLSCVLIFASVRYDLSIKSGVRQEKYPEGAVKFLKENRISGNMFNPYYWGGYLIWALYPEQKVFIDGRGLIEDIYFQYLNAFQAKPQIFEGLPEWKAVLRAYHVNFILTFAVDKFTGKLVPLIPALYNDPEWHLVYMDKISLIFLRESLENRALIERFGLPKEWLWGEVVTEALVKIKDSPRKTNFYITIGDAFLAGKNPVDAQAAYMKAVEMDPDNPTVNERLRYLKSFNSPMQR